MLDGMTAQEMQAQETAVQLAAAPPSRDWSALRLMLGREPTEIERIRFFAGFGLPEQATR